jgi:ribonuclease inhibitor
MTMRQVIIDGEVITDREALHDAFVRQLDLPEWYGRNLDALFDCLTDIGEDTAILVRDPDALQAHLGRYGASLLRMLRRAAEENPYVELV